MPILNQLIKKQKYIKKLSNFASCLDSSTLSPTNEQLTYIKNDDSDIRIDRWLRRKFSDLPQSFFEKKLRKGLIRLNNKIIKSNKKIFYNDIIEIFDYEQHLEISLLLFCATNFFLSKNCSSARAQEMFDSIINNKTKASFIP